MGHYNPDQHVFSINWAPHVLDGATGLRAACSALCVSTLGQLALAWDANTDKLRELLGNGHARIAAVKAVLAQVAAKTDQPAPLAAKPAPVSKPGTPAKRTAPIPAPVSTAARSVKAEPAEAPATGKQWPPKMPRDGSETPRKAALLDKMDRALALIAAGKRNGEIERELAVSSNTVSNWRNKHEVFGDLVDQVRATLEPTGPASRTEPEGDPQASAVTEKLPPRPLVALLPTPKIPIRRDVPKAHPAALASFDSDGTPNHELPPVEDGPADHLADTPELRTRPASFKPLGRRVGSREFMIPLDAEREAMLVIPAGFEIGDAVAISEYLQFLCRRLMPLTT